MRFNRRFATGFMAAAATFTLEFTPMAQAAPIDDPMFTFSFVDLSGDAGSGSLDASLVTAGEYNATSGSLTLTGSHFPGSYSLVPGGPGETDLGAVLTYDNDIYPSATDELDSNGLLFGNANQLINLSDVAGQLNITFYENDGSGVPIEGFFAPESDFSVALVTPAPEPATLTLFTSGLLGLGWMRRRRVW
jgi:PEP-CTERM motif